MNAENGKLDGMIGKYNREVAGWQQVKAKSLSSEAEYEAVADELSWALPRNIEDYIFVNQLTNKQEAEKLRDPANQEQAVGSR